MRKTFYLPHGAGFSQYAPYLIDMINGNHVLIAGTTGAGKSVLENAIMYALLCTRFPGIDDNGRNINFVLLDPKRVELKCYENIPHVIRYADTIEDIESALRSVRELIETRLQTMQRNRQRKSSEVPIYVFIDELVDLVTNKQHGKEIVRLLSDSASISRAANIFFVALTQSPSRAILPAQFKLLFNCRVALFCNNRIESQQIIDDGSATELPEHGLAIVQQNIHRYKIKIPMYSDEEIDNMIAFWERQNRPVGLLERLFRR